LIGAAPAQAQQQDNQLWLQVNTNLPVTERVRLTLEQIARSSDQLGGIFHTEIGGIISYQLVQGVELGPRLPQSWRTQPQLCR
jgi:hypothetical protein